MKIARELYDQLIAHARAEAPNECCGMIASADDSAVRIFPAENTAASPLRYEIDGRQQLEILDAIEDAGHDLGAIYHSHTRSDPVPSQTDINLAKLGDSDQPSFPGTLYLIVGVKGAEDDLRLWSIVGNDVQPVEFQVTE